MVSRESHIVAARNTGWSSWLCGEVMDLHRVCLLLLQLKLCAQVSRSCLITLLILYCLLKSKVNKGLASMRGRVNRTDV